MIYDINDDITHDRCNAFADNYYQMIGSLMPNQIWDRLYRISLINIQQVNYKQLIDKLLLLT